MLFQDLTNVITPPSTSVISSFRATGYGSAYSYNRSIRWVSGLKPPNGATITATGVVDNVAYTFFPAAIIGDYTTGDGSYYLFIYNLYARTAFGGIITPTPDTELTCTYTSNRTYSEEIYAGLPQYSYIIGSYYNPSGRYSSLTTNIWARGSGATAQAYPQNLNLYSQYSNFQLNNDLTGNYIGNTLYELDCALDRPNISTTRLYLNYLENGALVKLDQEGGTSSAGPIGANLVPLASKYTVRVVNNTTNAIIAGETGPIDITTTTSGYITISTSITATASGTISGTWPGPMIFKVTESKTGTFSIGMVLTGTGVVSGTRIIGGSSPNWIVDKTNSITTARTITGTWSDDGSSSIDYIIKVYAYDDPYSNPKVLSRLRGEERFPVVNLKPRIWVSGSTFTFPVTQDGSLILTNSTSANTNNYRDVVATCLDNERKTSGTSSTQYTTYPQLTYVGYNDQDTASLKYTTQTVNYFSNIAEVFSATFNAAKTTVTGSGRLQWGNRTPYPGLVMVDTRDWTVSAVKITAVSYNATRDEYTFTLARAWTGSAQVGFKYDIPPLSYKKYTKDPASLISYNGNNPDYTPGNLSYPYFYRHAIEDRYLSAGFFTILPLYSIKKLDGTLIGTFRDTTLFTVASSPNSARSSNYTPRPITGSTTARWWIPIANSAANYNTEYNKLALTDSAYLSRTKIQEFYYTYGPCLLEFTAVILKRTIDSAQNVSSAHTGSGAATGYVVGPSPTDFMTAKGYTETETTEIIRIKVQETVVPMITPPINLIRPSSLIAFNTTAENYKISFNAARVTTKYRDSEKLLIENIDRVTNTLTITKHGLKNNQIIRYGSYGTVAKGLKNNNYYYVVYYTANTFGLKTDSVAINITSTGSPGDQYIYLDSSRYILTSELSKIKNSVIYFDTPHNLTTGDRILHLAPTSTNPPTSINLTHYTYYIASRVDDYAIKLSDTENNPVTITITPNFVINPINITASESSNTSNYWYGSYTIDSAKDQVQIDLNWTVPWNVNYYTFNIYATSLDAINYEISNGRGSYVSGNDGVEIKLTTPTGTYYNYGPSSFGTYTGTIAAAATSRTISIQVKSLTAQGSTYQQGNLNFYVKFTKGADVYLGDFTLAKLPDTIQEVTDKNAGYISVGTETAAQATPSKILYGASLTGTSLNVKLYADKATATQLSSVNIPIVGNLAGTNAVTFQNSAAFYGLTEVGFLPAGADIKHYGIPVSNSNWNYVQYNPTPEKLNNQSSFNISHDFSINTSTSIVGGSGSPSHVISSTSHGLSTGAPVRIAIPNLTSFNSTNYNFITKVKRNTGGNGSWLGTASAHGYATGDIVMYKQGFNDRTNTYLNLLDVLVPNKKYYIIVIDTTWFKLAVDPEEAAAGRGITFNSFGRFGTQIVDGVDTKTATIYFKYAQTEAADAVNYYSTTVNPVSAIYNQDTYDKTTSALDNSTFRFKYPGPDQYSQQVYTTLTGSSLATTVFGSIDIGYLDNLSRFPKNINCYDTYYAVVVDANRFRLARTYADAVALVPKYIPIEPATIGTTASVYIGVAAPTEITGPGGSSVIKDEILLGTQNSLALSICWNYTLGTGNTSSDNIDGFIVYVNTAGPAGSDPINDIRYVVPYNDYYTTNRYNIVIYNIPKPAGRDRVYVAIAAYRYRNHFDYRHNIFFGTDAQEFQRSKLLTDNKPITTNTSDKTALTLADGTTYTTTKRFFIPKFNLAYNASQGYATPQSTLTIDGRAGTISLTKNNVNLSAADLESKYTAEATASYYIPYLSTSGTYQYISSKQTIYYSSNTLLETYTSTTNNKQALFIKSIPSSFTGTSGITLNTNINAPVIVNNVSLDTVTAVSGNSITTTQKVISIGPTIVQNAYKSLRLLIPVIDSNTNTVSIVEVRYQAAGTELSKLNFNTIIEVLGT